MSIHIFMSTPRLIMTFDLIIITLFTVQDSIKKGEEKLIMVFKVIGFFLLFLKKGTPTMVAVTRVGGQIWVTERKLAFHEATESNSISMLLKILYPSRGRRN